MSTARTLTVTVPADIADALDESIRQGEFASESEALIAAARSWERGRALEHIRRQIRESMEDPRPSVPIDEVEERIEQYMADRR
jgi:Arc/MetJ-type ribon-helix-helix transcriptional regulator